MASGNLRDFGTVTVRSDKVEISTYVGWAKAHIVHLIAVLTTAVALLTSINSAIDKYYPVVNNPPAVVVDNSENKLLSMDVNLEKAYKDALENNVISDFPTGRNMASKFSDSAISASLIVPDKVVDVYKFVKIKTDKEASFYDLMVMTVYNGNIVFVDAVQTANKGEWVFTGPPGQYAVRLSSYNPTTGVSVDTGNVIIGEPIPVTEQVVVPNIVGMTYGNAAKLLTANKLFIKVGTRSKIAEDDGDGDAMIISQNPLAGNKVDINSVITANITAPVVKQVSVPNFVGKNYFEAQSIAVSVGISLKTTNPDSTGEVISQSVASGTYVDRGSVVNVVVTSKPVPPPVFTEKYGFSTFAFNEAMSKVDAESRKAYKNGLADNFEAVAASIAAGAFTDVKSSQIELAGRNRLTLNNNDSATVQKWTAFFSGWSARATELNKSGTLPNVLEEYRLVYLETAKGLRAVAQ